MRIRWLYVNLLISLLVGAALACAVAPPPGFHANLWGEDVLIVWDPVGKTEHMIRRANFSFSQDASSPGPKSAEAESFGFLVPTPTRPELAEAPDEAFDRLVEEMQPRDKAWEFRSFLLENVIGSFMVRSRGAPMSADKSGVQLLATQRVAGYDAAILKASDPAALSGWLKEHGYPSSPELEKWLVPYVDKGFILTAFKISPGTEDPEVGTKAVRLSFSTEKPYFPYREPAGTAEDLYNRRLFRVFFVASDRYQGSAFWPGRTLYSAPIANARGLLEGCLPPSQQPAEGAWLTTFLDESTEREDEDLSFEPAARQEKIVPAPVRGRTTFPVYLDLLLIVVFVFGIMAKRRRRITSPGAS